MDSVLAQSHLLASLCFVNSDANGNKGRLDVLGTENQSHNPCMVFSNLYWKHKHMQSIHSVCISYISVIFRPSCTQKIFVYPFKS